MKILILGKTGHGKDEVAKIIAEKTGLKYMSSSEVALSYIWPTLKFHSAMAGDEYESKEQAFEDRNNGNQMLWKNLISLLNTPDRTFLTRKILEQADIYVGMRDFLEYNATMNLFDRIIWVDASDRIPDHSINSMEIPYNSKAMFMLDNNGDIDYLRNEIDQLLKALQVDSIVPEIEPVRNVILNWANDVFPDRTITNALQKLVMEEIPELLLKQDDPMEIADLGILVHDIANLAGYDLDEIMREKMAVNIARKWKIDKVTGLMNHVKGDE